MGGTYLAVGESGTILVSSNGSTWSSAKVVNEF